MSDNKKQVSENQQAQTESLEKDKDTTKKETATAGKNKTEITEIKGTAQVEVNSGAGKKAAQSKPKSTSKIGDFTRTDY